MLNIFDAVINRVEATWQEWQSQATQDQLAEFWDRAEELHEDCTKFYELAQDARDDVSAMAMILTSVMKRVFRPETARAIPVRPLEECHTVDHLAAFVIGGTQDA